MQGPGEFIAHIINQYPRGLASLLMEPMLPMTTGNGSFAGAKGESEHRARGHGL